MATPLHGLVVDGHRAPALPGEAGCSGRWCIPGARTGHVASTSREALIPLFSSGITGRDRHCQLWQVPPPVMVDSNVIALTGVPETPTLVEVDKIMKRRRQPQERRTAEHPLHLLLGPAARALGPSVAVRALMRQRMPVS